jgi:hypothetical protein
MLGGPGGVPHVPRPANWAPRWRWAIELAFVVTFVALVRGDETILNGSVVIALLPPARYLNSICRYDGETLSGGQEAVER